MLAVFAALERPASGVRPGPDGHDSPWFLVYAPFVLFGTLSFLRLAAGGRDEPRLRPGGAQADRGQLAAAVVPLGRRLPAGLRRADRSAPQQPGPTSPRCAPPTRARSPPTSSTTRPARRLRPWPGGSASPTRPGRTAAGSRSRATCCTGSSISDSDYILLLDADFAPRPDLLDETLPYMDLHPDVGIVQTPQFFHVVDEQTWVERGAGRGPGAVLPVHPDRPGQEGRRDLRGQLRRLPQGRARRRTAACRWPSTRRTCTPASTCAGWAGGCATCRSRCPPGTARTTSWRSSTSSTAGARAP